MVPIDTLIPLLSPHVNGCPRPLSRRALIDAAREFCTLTDAIEVTSDPIATIPGVAEYEVDAGPGMEMVRVVRAWLGATPLTTVASSQVMLPRNAVLGTPTHLRVAAGYEDSNDEQDAVAVLLPTPDSATPALVVRMSVRPTRTARSLPTQLVREWADAVVMGAVARVRSIPGRPFTDLVSAAAARSDFTSGVSAARVRHQSGMVRANTRVRGPRFF